MKLYAIKERSTGKIYLSEIELDGNICTIEVTEPKSSCAPLTEDQKIENLRLAYHDMNTFERGYRRAKELFSRPPKKTVTREAVQDGDHYLSNGMTAILYKVPRGAKNVHCTYDAEE